MGPSVGACEVHYVLDGPEGASTVVLINSLGSDLGVWNEQIRPLRERRRVVRFDLRGHGRSPVPAGPYSLADLGGDLVALLDRLGIARASFCGLSLGGAVAMWAAVHAPERVDRLVVCFSSDQFGTPQGWLDRAALVRTDGAEAVADAVVARWFTTATRSARPELIRRMRAMIAATPAEGYAGCCEALATLDLRAELGSITAPTMVLSGSEDPATPPEHGRRIAAAIPGAHYVEISAAAHLGNVERPEPVNRLLLEHLGRACPPINLSAPNQAKEKSR
jgi:3-oxoadipate enol-lactonase